MLTASSTRDLVRFRRFNTPILEIAQTFLSALSEDTPQATSLRAAFFPALLGVEGRPKDRLAVQTADERLRGLFQQGPSSIIVPQGNISGQQINAAWGEGKGPVYDSLFLGWSLHQQLADARSSGEKVEEANLGIMIIATLAHELAQWIFVQVSHHAYNGEGKTLGAKLTQDSQTHGRLSAMDDGASMHTTDTRDTRGSQTSYGSLALVRPKNRQDVGDKAVIALFGCDFELLSYTIGDHQVVKRRYPSRRSPTMTPPIIYSIIKDTPAILDVTSHTSTTARTVPSWRDQNDTMYTVVSVLTPGGTSAFHGDCTLPGAGLEFWTRAARLLPYTVLRLPSEMAGDSINSLLRQRSELDARIAEAERLRFAEEQDRSISNGSRVLVHNSPSPRKKRSRSHVDIDNNDSTRRGPPPPPHPNFSVKHSHKQSSTSASSSKSSFASHESALPKSNLLKGFEDIARRQKEGEVKKKLVARRSTAFSTYPSASNSTSISISDRKGKGKEVLNVRASSTPSNGIGPSRDDKSSHSALSESLALRPAMTRHVPSKPPSAPLNRSSYSAQRQLIHNDARDDEQDEDEDEDGLDIVGGPPKDAIKRRQDWTVIESIPVGPVNHKWNKNDPDFEQLEPNSGIRLRTPRTISHAQLQLHLSDRYHLSSSLLYSLARTTPSGGLEVDVDRDFIVIGVLAWKDETRYTKTPKPPSSNATAKPNPWDHIKDTADSTSIPPEEQDTEAFSKEDLKERPRRYIRFSLVDLSTVENARSGTGTVNLMLFEATEEVESRAEGGK
ncbi:hypothetical protein P7C70_g3668, partial [Phenoliferia sp. Uapishka_3]